MRILHLSDLHFGCRFSLPIEHRNEYLNEFYETLETIQDENPIHFVVISGDLVHKCQNYDESLKTFFLNIAKVLNFDGFDHFLICPGNHDCDCNTGNEAVYLETKEVADQGLNMDRLRELESPFSAYIEFCKDMGMPLYKIGKEESYVAGVREIDGYNLVCINTAWYTQFDRESSFVGSSYTAAMKDALKDRKGCTLTVMHHPPGKWHESQNSNHPGTRNVLRLIEAFSDIVFHGHTHEMENTAEWKGNMKVPFVGTGPLFSDDTWSKTFYLYDFDIDSGKCHRCLYSYNNGWRHFADHDAIDLSRRFKKDIFEKSFYELRHINGFFGRNEIVDSIARVLETPNHGPYIVYGAPGVGKTEICREVLNKIRSGRWEPRRPINLQGRIGFDGLLDALGEALEIPSERRHENVIYGKLAARCEQMPSVLYLDNFEDVLLHPPEPAHIDPRVYRFLNYCKSIPGLRLLISCRENLGNDIQGQIIECLDDKSAWELFRNGWGKSRIDRLSEQNQSKLKTFIKTHLANHALTIVIATGQHDKYEISTLMEIWEKESGRLEINEAEASTPRSLKEMLSRSYRIIAQAELCCEIWGVLAFCAKSMKKDFFKGFYADRLSNAEEAMEKLIHINLVYRDGENFDMLPPIKQQVFEVASSPIKLYSNVIDNLTRYYRNNLETTFPGQDNWEENSKRMLPLVDDILFFMSTLLEAKQLTPVLQIHARMANFYQLRVIQARPLIDKLMEYREQIELQQYANMLWMRGDLERLLNNNRSAKSFYDQAKSIFVHGRETWGVWGLAQVNRKIGDIQRNMKQESMPLLKDAKEKYESAKDMVGFANTIKIEADVYRNKMYFDEAKRLYDQALIIYRAQHDEQGQANVLSWLGEIARRKGKLDEAIEYFNEALNIYNDIGNERGQANVYQGLGDLWQSNGNFKEACTNYANALALYKREYAYKGLACTLAEFCVVYAQLQEYGRVREMLLEAERVIKEIKEQERHNTIDDNVIEYVQSRIQDSKNILKNGVHDLSDSKIDKLTLPRDFAKYTEGLSLDEKAYHYI